MKSKSKQKTKVRKDIRNILVVIAVLLLSSVIVYHVYNTFAYSDSIPTANVLTPGKKAKLKKVPAATYDAQLAKEIKTVEAEINTLNDKNGEMTDIDTADTVASPLKVEPEVLDATDVSATPPNYTNTSNVISSVTNFLANSGLLSTATAKDDSIITGKITFGKKGKYTKLKDSKAGTKKQTDGSWGTKKYGSRIVNKKNVCSTFGTAGCAPSAISNALAKYISTSPLAIGNYIKDNYSSYRNTYTKGNECNNGTNKQAIANVPGNFLTSDQYLIGSAKVSWDSAKLAVNSNYPVIFKTTNSKFTSSGHYLVIRGKIKRKSDGKVYYWLSDSGGKNIKAATEATIQSGNGGFWKIYKTDLQVS